MLHDHGLTPNHSKTKLLQVTRSRTAPAVYISIDDYPLSPSKTVKYLGVTLSSNLSLLEHINSVCKTAKCHLDLVNQKLRQASPQVCHAIYPSTILSKLDYCCAVWDPHYSTDKTALNRVQLFASKVITHKWHANHSTMLNSLNWQPLEIRKRLIKIKVCYNIPNNYSCIYPLLFLTHTLLPVYVIFMTECSLDQMPRPTPIDTLDILSIWNSLPADVIRSLSPSSFKTKILALYS